MNTMTIGKKLSAGFAVLGLMMAFIGGFSLFEFSTMNRAAIGFTDSILPAVVRTSTLGETVIPPFLGAFKSRGHAAFARCCFGV